MLDLFDQKAGVFIHYKLPQLEGDVVIRSIYEDKKGNIWIATDAGVGLVYQKEKFIWVYKHPEHPNLRTFSLLEDSKGNFWVGSFQYGVFLFNRQNKTFTAVTYVKEPVNPSSQVPVHEREKVLAIYEDQQKDLWMGTNNGLYRFDKSSNTFVLYEDPKNDPDGLSDKPIRSLTEDMEGNLWIGHSNGISILNKERSGFRHQQYSLDRPWGVNNNFVTCVFKDRSHNIWVGTRNSGLNVYYPFANRFTLYRHEPNNERSLNNNIVKAIVKDKKGRVWLGTDGGGLNLLQPDGTFTAYKHDPANPGSLPNNLILALYVDKADNLWVSTFNGGLSVMNKRGDFDHIYLAKDSIPSLRRSSVSVMYEDSKSNMWIGTWYAGLLRLNRKTGKWKYYSYNPEDPAALSSEKVIDIYEDSKGRLWVGTAAGLNLYHPGSENFTHYEKDDKIKTSISNSVCNSICEDNSGRLWIGTNGGLNLFNPETSVFAYYGIKNGLPDEVIQGILADGKGNLWISTLKGISMFTPATGRFRNFQVSDGLQGSEFISHSYFKSAEGEIFFGGNNGVNVIYPEQVKTNSFVPPVAFTDFRLFNKSVSPGDKNHILEKHISYADTIELSYRESVFSFEFAALSYTQSEKNQYAYKMEGFDDNWNYVGTERTATYTNLDPGEYVFKVKAANNDGIWNEQGASISIIITPPFWETTWFRILSVLLLVGGLITLYQVRVGLIKRQKKKLEEEVKKRTKTEESLRQLSAHLHEVREEERIRIAREIHDELGQQLTVLKMDVSWVLKKLAPTDDANRQKLEDMMDMLGHTVKTVRRIASELRPTLLDDLGLIAAMEWHLKEFEERFGIKTQLEEPGEQLSLSDTAKIGLFRIFQESLTNVARHSQAKKVKISLSVKNEYIILCIEDDGIGFDQEKISRKRTLGILGMKERTAMIRGNYEISSINGKGTTIVVSVPLQSEVGEKGKSV
jgi:signal transduction histidine kinase/ligand-binding sensor domain-containing protein